MNKYIYEGPVKEFDNIIRHCWFGSTMAVSERKARSNLAYQFKRQHGRTANTKISLPGELVMIEMEGYMYED